MFEQGEQTGGKMNRIEFDSCVFDTGPTLITMPFVLENYFSSIGLTLADNLTLCKVEPACHYRWSDGSSLDLPFEMDDVARAIEDFAPGNGAPVSRYLEQARELYDLTKDVFIFSPFRGFRVFWSLKNVRMLPHLHRLRFMSSLHSVHSKTFSDPRIVQLFDRFATYNGSSPYLAPATLMVIPWVEIGLGAWYVKGGIYTIAEVFTRVAQENGVRIHLRSRVESINVERGTACGVTLTDGSIIAADHVVSNADVFVTRRHLLGVELDEPTNLSSSGLVMLMSVEKADHGLAQHNVLFSDDYPGEFAALATEDRPRKNASIYISRSSHADVTQAPSDRENWFVLVNAPPKGKSNVHDQDQISSWDGHAETQAQLVLEQMSSFGVRPVVRQMMIRTPDTMASEWSSYKGALYGSSSNSMFSAFLRPRQRSSDVANLWYVGGSAHPGGGVPLVITSGMIAADLILSSLST